MLIGIIFLKPMWGYLAFDPPNSSSSSVNFISNRLISVWVQPQKFIHTTCTLCVCELLIHQYMCTYMYIVPPCHGLWCHVTHVTFHLSSSTSGPLLDSVGTPATPLLLDLNRYTCDTQRLISTVATLKPKTLVLKISFMGVARFKNGGILIIH